jgi:L-alanine-DL-glutamate epimerase-like enolase superfamily enzyme
VQSLLTITTDDGAAGRCFGVVNEGAIVQIVTPMLLGEDPFYRERIWNALKERQRMNLSSLPDRVLTAIDLALWDLAGQALGLYYERGLLHPFVDYDAPPAWLNESVDPMDAEGYVHVSNKPGLGLDINFDYIRDHLVPA